MLFNSFNIFFNCFYIEINLSLNFSSGEFNIGYSVEPDFKAWFVLSLFVFTFTIELAPFIK